MNPQPQTSETQSGTPSRKRTFWHRLGWQALRLAGIYLGVLLVLLALENWFLFHPDTAAASWDPPPAGAGVEDINLTSSDGTSLHAWWLKPSGWEPDHGAVLFFHGNAGNLSHRGESMVRWRDELRMAVLIVDYPGYGRSKGTPTEAGCNAAGEAAHEWVTRQAGVPGPRVILVGVSLGGSVATHVASHPGLLCQSGPCRALVLIASFTSFPDMAQKQFPWLPARWLVRNQMNNLARIRTIKQPVFIAHSTGDGLIPYWMGERLFEAARQPKRFFTIQGLPHDEFVPNDCFAALKAFLNETSGDW